MSKKAIIVIFLILLAGGLWWVKSYSVKNIAYYNSVCPERAIVITGKGYCVDKGGIPYFPRNSPHKLKPAGKSLLPK